MTDNLDDLTDELERIAARLRAADIEPDEAARLIDDCARAAARAASELEGRVREAGSSPPGQETLI